MEILDVALAPASRLVELGGPVVSVLLAMSVLAVGVIVLKAWQFLSLGLFRARFIEHALRYWHAGRMHEAMHVLGRRPHPVAAVLRTAMDGLAAAVPEALLREEVARQGIEATEALRSHVRLLELIATLSPLLGLYGTVIGMIDAFQQLDRGGAQVDPSALSGGIWVALLTTAVGLAVAIPAAAAASVLAGIADRVAHRMEDAATRVFTAGGIAGLAAPGLTPASLTAAG